MQQRELERIIEARSNGAPLTITPDLYNGRFLHDDGDLWPDHGQRAIWSALCQHRGGHHPIAGHAMGHPLGAADGGGHGCRQFGGLRCGSPAARGRVPLRPCQCHERMPAARRQRRCAAHGQLHGPAAPGQGPTAGQWCPVAMALQTGKQGHSRSNSAQRSSLASSCHCRNPYLCRAPWKPAFLPPMPSCMGRSG